MARRAASSAKKTISRVTAAVKKTAKKVTAKLRPANAKTAAKPAAKTPAPPAVGNRRTTARKHRPTKDVARKGAPAIPASTAIPEYTPTQTSLKGSFRSSGAERQRDQDSAADRWNDEDRLTNKSGDPRIGTHGRTYEPGESRPKSKGSK